MDICTEPIEKLRESLRLHKPVGGHMKGGDLFIDQIKNQEVQRLTGKPEMKSQSEMT